MNERSDGSRVVVTGMGVVSSAGVGCKALADAAAAGRCTLSRISDPRVAHFRAKFAGQVREIPAECGWPAPPAEADRHIFLAFAAAAEALADAGLQGGDDDSRMGLVHATCSGPMLTIERQYAARIAGDLRCTAVDPEARRYDSGALVLSRAFGISGPVITVVTACSASTCAMGIAYDLIRIGVIDIALVGGADAFSLTTLAGFDALRATCEEQCAPFSKPVGMCLGEAGAYVVLESLVSACRRGVRQRAEIVGYGSSNDAYHCSAPDPRGRGAVLAIRRALADAGLEPERVGYVNAHGTGTESNDKAEARALRTVFGDKGPAVSATKSVTGHCLGAAGAVELIASILCAERNVLPPTANFAVVREGCALRHVTAPGLPWPSARTLVSVNLAFGGHNACLAVRPGPAEAIGATVRRREDVVVTGCGVVTPHAPDIAALRTLMADVSLRPEESMLAAGPDLDLRALDRRLNSRHLDRSSTAAVASAVLALRHGGIPLPRPGQGSDIGLYVSVMHAPLWAESEHLRAVLENHYHIERPSVFPYVVANAVDGVVAREVGLTGHNAAFCLGEGGGVTVLALAYCAMCLDRAPALLSLVADECPTDEWLGSDCAVQACEGNAAVAVLLETSSHARSRHAAVLAVVRGLAFAGPGPKGTDRVERLTSLLRTALSQADAEPADIAAVCCDRRNGLELEVLRRIGDGLVGRIVDLGDAVGRAPACGSALSLAVMLGSQSAERKRKYILACVGSPSGYDSIVVFSRDPSA